MKAAAGRRADAALTATQVVYLALMWLLACVPLVTAPAASVALVDQIHAWRVRGDSPTAAGYARRLRTGFVQRSVAMCAVMLIVALVVLDLWAIGRMGSQRGAVLVLWLAVAICAVLLTALLPGLLARGITGVTAWRLSARLAFLRPLRAIAVVAAATAVAMLAPVMPLVTPLLAVGLAAVVERSASHALDAVESTLRTEGTHPA